MFPLDTAILDHHHCCKLVCFLLWIQLSSIITVVVIPFNFVKISNGHSHMWMLNWGEKVVFKCWMKWGGDRALVDLRQVTSDGVVMCWLLWDRCIGLMVKAVQLIGGMRWLSCYRTVTVIFFFVAANFILGQKYTHAPTHTHIYICIHIHYKTQPILLDPFLEPVMFM